MSNSKSRAAQNVHRFSPSVRPAAFERRSTGRGQTPLEKWGVIAPDVLEAQKAPRPIIDVVFETRESEIEDRWSRLDTALESVGSHVLVIKWGFGPDQLIDQSDYEHPKPIDATILGVWVEACELAAGRLGFPETFKVLGIEYKGQPLASVGKALFFKRELIAARIIEIETEKKRKEEKKMTSSIPTRRSSAPTPRQIPAAPTERPEGSNNLGQIELAPGIWGYTCACGCGAKMTPEYARVLGFEAMRERQNGDRAEVSHLWRHAFAQNCIRGEKSYPLLTTRGQIEAYDAETARRQAAYRAEQARLEAERNLREQARLERDARHRGSIFKETPMRQGKTARDALKKGHRRAA
ncbi:hypothetical protein HYV70_00590 [Candidatus Uhrbacteria bacterium]|nr:hypothetical protein [Candidatus Uhrbacteria bacterium]